MQTDDEPDQVFTSVQICFTALQRRDIKRDLKKLCCYAVEVQDRSSLGIDVRTVLLHSDSAFPLKLILITQIQVDPSCCGY